MPASASQPEVWPTASRRARLGCRSGACHAERFSRTSCSASCASPAAAAPRCAALIALVCAARRGSSQRQSESACAPRPSRSEEHTSELQSLAYLVCRLLLEKKKKNKFFF